MSATDISNATDRLAPTTASQRRRRHLSVYHRALRSANTPEQRAAVAARYRKLFASTTMTQPDLAETIVLPVAHADIVRLAS